MQIGAQGNRCAGANRIGRPGNDAAVDERAVEEIETGRSAAEPSQPPASRILVVDDERSMREMLGILLRRDGHDLTIAESGREAIDLLQKGSFDLVVSDVDMPRMDGLDLTEIGRAHV